MDGGNGLRKLKRNLTEMSDGVTFEPVTKEDCLPLGGGGWRNVNFPLKGHLVIMPSIREETLNLTGKKLPKEKDL